MTVLNNEDPADPSVHEPVETVPWPTVTRYSGGASHEGIGGRVWIRLSDDGPEVEYVPAGALEALQAWRDTVEDMLSVQHEVASDDPRESINRLINRNVAVALDPVVSSDAQALIDHGKALAGTPSEDALSAAYEAGWRTAAGWAERDDLIADIGSPAYLADCAAALAAQEQKHV